jgi:hypothetical protein
MCLSFDSGFGSEVLKALLLKEKCIRTHILKSYEVGDLNKCLRDSDIFLPQSTGYVIYHLNI